MKRLTRICTVFLVLTSSALAQQHIHPESSPVVSGAARPDLVSDSDAQRHFLLSRDVGFLPATDRVRAAEILENFNAQWQKQIDEYNAYATEENNAGRAADVQPLLAARDAFVTATLSQLHNSISPIGMDRIHTAVQLHKQRMFVSTESRLVSEKQKSRRLSPVGFRQGPPQGQCTGASYTTTLAGSDVYTVLSNPTSTTAKVQLSTRVDGSVSNMVGRPVGCNLNTFGVVHTPSFSTKVNGVTYSATGGGVCANCYISGFLNTVVVVPTGTPIPVESVNTVACSFGGIFFTYHWDIDFEVAFTMSRNIGGSAWAWSLDPWCTIATSPPDFNPKKAIFQAFYPYYLGEAICTTSTLWHGWSCAPGFDIGNPTAPPSGFPCTKNPPLN